MINSQLTLAELKVALEEEEHRRAEEEGALNASSLQV